MTSHSRFVNSSDARSEANVSSRRSDRLSSAIYTAPGLFIPSKALDHPADSNKEHTDVDNRLRNGARSISECADRHLGVIVRRDPTADGRSLPPHEGNQQRRSARRVESM